ncbi:hypothetical protein EYF80_039678 [Liparis tanakae]|uniref:Uncharacterized protein n=1 Tax=Liparis tanakae TaxID=230148 RepID=A0A4Z2GAN3_9TELE|nr:hypothetical protein EYF80_039678 [Liparis tanakae]
MQAGSSSSLGVGQDRRKRRDRKPLRSEDRGSFVSVSEERKKGSEGEEDPGNAGDGPPPHIEN